MGTNKREPTLEDLLSDPVMATLLEHAQQTPDDMRAMIVRRQHSWDRTGGLRKGGFLAHRSSKEKRR